MIMEFDKLLAVIVFQFIYHMLNKGMCRFKLYVYLFNLIAEYKQAELNHFFCRQLKTELF